MKLARDTPRAGAGINLFLRKQRDFRDEQRKAAHLIGNAIEIVERSRILVA
jgi:hypothetical protein